MKVTCNECGIEIDRFPSATIGHKYTFCCKPHQYSYFAKNHITGIANKKYTIEQEEYIRTHYTGTCNSAKQISQDLNIPYKHIFYLVKKLGIGKRLKKFKPWTESEEERLKDEVARLSLITIANRHNRSPIAIKDRCQELGISRKGRDGWYNERDICEIFGVTHEWLVRRIENNRIQAEKRGNQWCVTRDNLIEYIRSNPHNIDGRKIDMFYFVDLLIGVH